MVQFFDPYEDAPVKTPKNTSPGEGGYWLLPGHPDYDDSPDADYYRTNWRERLTLCQRLVKLRQHIRGYFRGLPGECGPTGAMGPTGNTGPKGDVLFLDTHSAKRLFLMPEGREALKEALAQLIKEDPSLLSRLK